MKNTRTTTQRYLIALGCLVLIGSWGCGKETSDGTKDTKASTSKGSDGTTKKSAKAEALGVASVHVHNDASFAVMTDGTVRAWGTNEHGNLGTGEIGSDAATPVEVEGLKGVKRMAVGASNLDVTACAILKGGDVKCWGSADLIPGVSKDTTKPTEVASLKGAKAISLGMGHGCAVMKDDTVSCWGRGHSGALGQGSKGDKKEPAPVEGLADIKDVKAGRAHTCALHSDGAVSCFGNNFDGQSDPTNPGMNNNVMKPKKVAGATDAVALGLGSDVSCIVTKANKVECWGDYVRGKKESTELPDSEGAVALSDSYGETPCFAKKDGALYCFGENKFGEAGVDPKKNKSPGGKPVKVAGISGVTTVSTAYDSRHTCASTKDGDALCWGRNRYGALGDGTLVDRHTPKPVDGIKDTKLAKAKDGFKTVVAVGKKTEFPSELPAGCKAPGELSASFEKGPGPKKFEIVHAMAKKSDRKHSDGVVGSKYAVHLRNYSFDPKLSVFDTDQKPRGLQYHLSLTLTRDKVTKEGDKTVKSALPVTKGGYKLGLNTGEERMEANIRGHLRYFTVFYGNGFGVMKPYEGVTLTYVGDDWICGELKLDNKKNSMVGTFAAPVVK